MEQEEAGSSLDYAMSTPGKRNTKRKHEEDHIGEEDPTYKNLYEWQRTLGVDGPKTIEMFNTIIDWFNANPHNKVQHLRSKDDNIKVAPLIRHFSEKYHMYFEEQSSGFVERSITWLIQRYLSKKRRSQEKRRPQANLLLEHVDQTITESRALPTVKSSLPLDENIILRAKREDSSGAESFCTVGDVLSEVPFDTMSINFIQRVSYNKWRDILCHDLEINSDYDALYDLGGQTLKIESDRHLKVAILFGHSHELSMIRFLVRLSKKDSPSDASRMSTISSIMFEPTNMSSNNRNQTFNAEHEQNKRRKPNESQEYDSPRRTQRRLSYDVISVESSSDDVLSADDVCFEKTSNNNIGNVERSLNTVTSNTLCENENIDSFISNDDKSSVHDELTQTIDSTSHPTVLFGDVVVEDPGSNFVIDDNESTNKVIDFSNVTPSDLMKLVQPTKTEHLHEDNRWDDCARFFCHDSRNIDSSNRIRVLGCAAEFYLYQAFGIYVMLEMEIFQNGGYNADDMGLGKTIEMLGVIALNRVLLKNHYEVQDARCREAWTMHLPKGTKENPQSSTAKCPSHNRYGIECPCVDDSPSARLRPTAGANLIVVPAALIAGWVKQTSIILRNDVLLGSWNIRQGYTHGRLDHLAPHLRIEDRPLLECTNDVFRDSACHADASTVVVITTKKCYNQHVVNLFTRVITLSKGKPRGKTLTRREVMKFAWGRACIDEAHQNQTATNGAVLIFKSIGSHVRKWFLTGTPFESSPDQMAYWVQTLQLGWDKHLITPANSWPRLDLYRRQLRECTFEKIKDLGKTHKRLIRFQSMDNTELNVYIEKLSTVLNTLWLRRTSDQSRFFDQPLTDVLPNIHQEIICRLPAKYVDIVNSDTGTITVALQQQLARQQAEADAKRKSGRVFVPEPEININNWLMKARRMRILSTFPRLGTLPATRSLSFTGDEDTKNGWVTLVDKKTYELKVTNSPYELHIEDICSAENCSKVKAINILITRTWDEGEKAIFTTMGPTNALILYWYLRIVHKARVALIHGKMDKSRVQKIVWLFQEDDTNDTTLEESPQYLVGTTKLIGVGFTMTKARRLVQLDPEWMSRDEQQARKRINRITQKGQTYTYALYSEGSQVEQMIHDRQNRRAHMMNLALDPNLTNVSKVTRGIGDDEDDNSDEEAEGMDNSNLRPEI